MSAPAFTKSASIARGSVIMRCTSFRSGVFTAFTMGAPIVSMGQKQPSITSKCTSCAPLVSSSAISAPRFRRSAVIMPTLSVGAASRRLLRTGDSRMPAAHHQERLCSSRSFFNAR